MNSEEIIKTVIAFASQKNWVEFEELIKQNPDVEKVYSEFIVNKKLSYIDVIDMIKKFENKLPKDFKEKFVEYHKKFKSKEQYLREHNSSIVAKVDKFTIVNHYKGLAKEQTYETFKAVIKLIEDAVKIMKEKGFASVIYGDIFLRNPQNPKSIAEYNYYSDEITLKFYRDYSGHAIESVIHELTHRIWYKLMDQKDKDKWQSEYTAKMNHSYQGQYSGFPEDYSKKNVQEYFATIVTEYIMKNKKYSELLDLIV
jgi:hypothetical protein